MDAWNHYQTNGIIEKRTYFHNRGFHYIKELFDWKKYVQYYQDLFHMNKKEAWEHWIKHGIWEGRTFFELTMDTKDIFDWVKYINTYPDLNHIKEKKEAWNHWKQYGKKEGREAFWKQE